LISTAALQNETC